MDSAPVKKLRKMKIRLKKDFDSIQTKEVYASFNENRKFSSIRDMAVRS